ncbi:TetR/AcrR family transcriptional regulator [Streptomyces sp. NPDC048644]|uniref:TetR/AcrR family transcriptional regulator n=1 Tax=Streptomyces sp. NPDC048644 TaxID=3365582 RepID=UPI003715E4A0
MGRPRQVEDEAVFAAMGTVLLRVGWARMTMSEIAAELGVTPAALRQRFGAKRELFAAFYDRHTEQLKPGGDDPPHDGSALDALRAMVRRSVAFVETPEQMRHAMSPLTEAGQDSDLQRMTRERFVAGVRHTTTLLELAHANGEITCSDPAGLARQLQHCLVGACLVWSFAAERPIADEALDAVGRTLAPYLPDHDR